MCEKQCSDIEECQYDRENCEYRCVGDDYSYSASGKVVVASGLAAFIAAINFQLQNVKPS